MAFNLKDISHYPSTGGNAISQEIAAATKVAQLMINFNPNDLNSNKIDDKIVSQFFLLHHEANYYTNRWVLRTPNSYLNLILKQVVRLAFYEGVAGLYRDLNDEYRAVRIIKLEQNSKGIKKAQIQIHNGVFNVNDKNYQNKENFAIIDVPENKLGDLIIYRFNTESIGAWVLMIPFINTLVMLEKMIATEAYVYLKKFKYSVLNPRGTKKEIEAFYDENNPFIVEIADTENQGLETNSFEMMEMKNNAQLSLKDYYEFILEKNYHMFGRRYNEDNKQSGERNIAGEIEASQYNFDVLEKEQYSLFIDFKRDLELMLGYVVEVM